MENDSIRSSGGDTLVEIWIEGKLRSICVSQEAIGAYVGFEEAARLRERDRCEFVRGNLPLVVNAAKARLRETGPAADIVVLDGGDLPRPDGTVGDRRKAERRKTERRKTERPKAGHQIERRRRERRQSERRTKSPSRSES